MTTPASFEIILDEDSPNFRVGETVSGQVKVTLTEQLSVTGIEGHLFGTCRVVRQRTKWCSILGKVYGRGQGCGDYAMETFVNRSTVFLGKEGDPNVQLQTENEKNKEVNDNQIEVTNYKGEIYDLPKGVHNYRFSFLLPEGMPGSFQTERGDAVGYELSATLWSLSVPPLQASKQIHVDAVFDLNSEIDLLKPALGYSERELGFACFSNGYLSGEIRLARKGAVSGDAISFMCEVDNKTGLPVIDAYVVLRKNVATHGKVCKRYHEDSSRVDLGTLDRHSKRRWENQIITLPAQMVAGRHWSLTMVVKYKVVLIAKLSHWPKTLEVPLQLSVGTAPFCRTTVARYRNQARINSTPPGGSLRGSPSQRSSPTGSISINTAGSRTSTLPKQQMPKRMSTASLITSSSLSLKNRSDAQNAQELVTALQRVRKHARAESLGKHPVENGHGSSRRSSQVFPPLQEVPTGSRRSTMSSQGDNNSPRVARFPRDRTKPPLPIARRTNSGGSTDKEITPNNSISKS